MVRLQLTNSEAMHVLRFIHYGADAIKDKLATNSVAAFMSAFGKKLDETIRQQLTVDTPPEHVEDLPFDSETSAEVLKNGRVDEKVTTPDVAVGRLQLMFKADKLPTSVINSLCKGMCVAEAAISIHVVGERSNPELTDYLLAHGAVLGQTIYVEHE